MRRKFFNTILMLVIVGPFTYFTVTEAVRIKQHLERQDSQIKSLTTESVKLDKKLDDTHSVKTQTVEEVQQLEQQATTTTEERKKLEAELAK